MAKCVPIVVVQGGAGSLSQHHDNEAQQHHVEGTQAAARAGYSVLLSGGSAVDAVEAAVISMENNPDFNAGVGAHLTIAGTIEMDASIMEGKALNTGAVVCVKDIANPVHLARTVMEKTPHTMFCGEAASKLARIFDCKTVTTDQLVTEACKQKLKRFPGHQSEVAQDLLKKWEARKDASEHDTVGAVALDSQGNVAYATSTGGMTGKFPGRIGDSPMVGAGGYADNLYGAVSTTGHGEAFVKTCLAHYITSLLRDGKTSQQAAEAGLQYLEQRVGGYGGVIVIDNKGDFGVHTLTEGMAWAAARDGVLHYGMKRAERMSMDL